VSSVSSPDGGRDRLSPDGPPADPGAEPVVAIVAAKDAADTVRATVEALRAVPGVDEVLVVDDGSSDSTSDEARRGGAWVLGLSHNRGKGGAVAAGVALAPHAGTYLLVDADVGATAAAAAPLLGPVLDGTADMTIGVLPAAGGRGGFGLVRDLAGAGIRRATGAPVRAPLSGQRAVRGALMRALDLAPRFGLETALTIDARRAGARVVEVDVGMDHRHTGRTVSGFAHRARQGADIVRALWPRLTSSQARLRLVALALLVAVAVALWSGGRWEPASVPSTGRSTKVLLVGMPGLRWDEVGTGRLPNLDRLIDEGALAAMTVRTLSRGPHPAEAYATLGAGGRVRASERAAQAATDPAGAGPLTVPDVAAVRRDAGRHAPSRPGALGDALHAGGKRTAVVGNADTAPGLVGTGVPATSRPAALALMDSRGRVDFGAVDPADLLMPDRPAPFGRRADPERVLARTAQALAQADVVLVDPGDLDREADLAHIAPADYAARSRARALDQTDALLGRLVTQAPPGTFVLVASTVPPTDEWRLTPVVAWGAGVVPGGLHSPSTRRQGLVTLTDLAPTVLAALGIDAPTAMVGHPLRYSGEPLDPSGLARLDRDVAYRERIYLGVALGFIAAQAAIYAGVAVVLSRRRAGARARRLLADAALAIAAFPLATFAFRGLSAAIGTDRLGRVGGAALLVAIDVALVAVVRRARRSALAPMALVLGATAWVIVVDVATGGWLQTGSVLGYSPQSAGRFYGIGNTAFAVLAACSLLAVALHLVHAPRPREALAAGAAFLALVLVVDAAPSLGDDVGGIFTLAPVFVLTVVALAGRRLTWRLVLGAALVALLVLAAAIGLDLLRPPESRTHLGRLVADTWRDGGDELFTTIGRKIDTNLRILRLTPWIWAVPVVCAFLFYLLRVRRRWNELLPPASPLRAGVLGALAAGVLGFLLNDSDRKSVV
jgi:hypothetical protein